MNKEPSEDAAERLGAVVDDDVASRERVDWPLEHLDDGNDPGMLLSQLV